jgi:hypothetical protein
MEGGAWRERGEAEEKGTRGIRHPPQMCGEVKKPLGRSAGRCHRFELADPRLGARFALWPTAHEALNSNLGLRLGLGLVTLRFRFSFFLAAWRKPNFGRPKSPKI